MVNKIDFTVVIGVRDSNPNGDPQNNNRPRQKTDGRGWISNVALTRKLRNRLFLTGNSILEMPTDQGGTEHNSLSKRVYEASPEMAKFIDEEKELQKGKKKPDTEAFLKRYGKALKENYLDCRLFGYLIAPKKNDKELTSTNVNARGALTITNAVSVKPVSITDVQLTKSFSNDAERHGTDTMGMKYNVDYGVYVASGSINPDVAEENGLTDSDIERVKQALASMYCGDETASRPAGSNAVLQVVWVEHQGSKYGVPDWKIAEGVKVVQGDTDKFSDVKVDYSALEQYDSLKVSTLIN